MAILKRADLLGATTPPQETVHIPQLGGDVIVRGMTGVERDAFEMSLLEGRGRNRQTNLKNLRAKLVAFCCVDEEGRRLFSDAEAEQLGLVRADVLNKRYTPASKLSGISEEDAEELGKPLKTETPSATSSSVSPAS